MDVTAIILLGAIIGFVIALVVAIVYVSNVSKALGISEESSRRKDDVIKAAQLAAKRSATIVDKVTKERFNFYEKAAHASSANDWVDLANSLLEVDQKPVERTDPGHG